MSDLAIFLLNYSEQFIYAGIFLILLLGGLGLPIPEELTLLTGGFLVNVGILQLYPTMIAAFVGVVVGDLVIYSIGRRWGQGILTHHLCRRVFTESRMEKARQFFRDHGRKTILIARFISGVRVATFLAAGTMKVSVGRFIFLDSLGAIIMVPFLTLLGFYFGASIGWLSEVVTHIDFLLKVLAVLACLAALGYYLLVWRKKRSSDPK